MIRRPMNLNWVIPAEGLRHNSYQLNRQELRWRFLFSRFDSLLNHSDGRNLQYNCTARCITPSS